MTLLSQILDKKILFKNLTVVKSYKVHLSKMTGPLKLLDNFIMLSYHYVGQRLFYISPNFGFYFTYLIWNRKLIVKTYQLPLVNWNCVPNFPQINGKLLPLAEFYFLPT